NAVRLSAWETAPPRPDKRTLTVPICGANYVKPRPKRAPTALAPSPNGKANDPPPRPIPTRTAPVAEPSPKPAPSAPATSPILQLARDGLTAFQQLQQQTAELHRQFLQGQETAQQALHRLLEQQHQLMAAALGGAPMPALTLPAPISPT